MTMIKIKTMKQFSMSIAVLALGMFAASCGTPTSQGQLVGVSNKMNYRAPTPLGMVFIPSGVMKSGYSDQDVAHSLDAEVRTFNMTGFYMDATEISNMEYRQFTNWVRDSIAHVILGDYKDNDDGTQSLDWSKRIKYNDQDTKDQLVGLFLDPSQTGSGTRELNTSKLIYNFRYFDYDAAAENPNQPQSSFVSQKTIHVYPDTLVWMRQFAYSNNEPITQQYNWFPAFDEYPVVGVNFYQANAFCDWRTKLWRDARAEKKMYTEGEFRLPTESQWEWAARGSRVLSPYPWGGPYAINQKGCYLANFKPKRGDYSADGGLYTVNVKSYWANDYGLYNMSGNVAEWTSSSYTMGAYNKNILSDMNPDIKRRIAEDAPAWETLKVVKGGSWRDPVDYLNVANRDYEFADTAKAYIGFRCIITQIDPAVKNQANRSNR